MHKFGDRRVNNICHKIKVGTYKEPDKLIWQYMKEDRLTPNQLACIIAAVKQKDY